MKRKMYKRRGQLRKSENFKTEVIKLAPYNILVTDELTGIGTQKCFEISVSKLALSLGTRSFDAFYQFRIKKYMVKVSAQRTIFGQTEWTVDHPKSVMFFQDPFNQILEQSAAGLAQNIEELPFVKKCNFMGGTKKGFPTLPHTNTVTFSGSITTSEIESTKRAGFIPTGTLPGVNYYCTSCYVPSWTNNSWDLPEVITPDNIMDNINTQKYRVEIWAIVDFKSKKPIGG